eukprot:jgi/Ulvmu1/4036/UM019_0013.1
MISTILSALLLAAGAASAVGMEAPKAICGSQFRMGAKLASTCGDTCTLPGGVSSAPDPDTCLAQCASTEGCHCALFNNGTCSQLWTPCDSAVVRLRLNPDGLVALQPCLSLPITRAPANASSQFGECKPMKLYPGWIITDFGCSSSDCTTTIAGNATTLDACIQACMDTGFDGCKSVQFKPAGSFGLTAPQCTLYDVQLEYMGAHATAQVVADGGLGAVAASYCEPPAGFTDFPDNERPDFGVDWEAVCEGEELSIVQDLNLACEDCVFIPANRQNRVRDNDFDELHYQSPSIESCAADCKANANCGCAFFRPTNFRTGSGFCALSNVECEAAAIGTEVDFTRIRSAITKCGYRASQAVRNSWPEDPYDPVDWFGIWDDVCGGGGQFTFEDSNTFCGPDCVLPGVHTVRFGTREMCDARCLSVDGCECSYYNPRAKLCTLMQQSGACRNFDNDPDALAYDLDPTTQNDVTLQCGPDPYAYY